jgi:phage-related protein
LYRICFYEDKKGRQPIAEYIEALAARTDKNSRIKYGKILDYIETLREHGTHAGEPYIKHLDDNIWELRPLRDRILFAALIDDGFVLLHCFVKKTQKTPASEIEQAKRELADWKERGSGNG